ncbi:hypothetical protein RSOLAG22IIIB_09579 [Rhizoctonia solani]|uniref:F-box domain-containing protein n=1 Tax=Rhizoctonia solani TaxID=456999 RepID=A0A0K6FZR4_9AGAM|nr:hypothetical protein RSOLAG22IIIB_09579 [Rhizoctonia solani]
MNLDFNPLLSAIQAQIPERQLADIMKRVDRETQEFCQALDSAFFPHLSQANNSGAKTEVGPGVDPEDNYATQHSVVTPSPPSLSQNYTASKLCSLPPEILLEIITLAVYDFPSTRPANDTVIEVYNRLFNIMGVCSTLRRLCISQGSLWALVPIFPEVPRYRTLRNISYSAGSCKLHLVAQTSKVHEPVFNRVLEQLTQCGKRFSSINFSSKHMTTIRAALECLLDNPSTTFGSVTELSLLSHVDPFINHLLPELHYAFPPGSPYQTKLSRWVETLQILRINGVYFHFANMIYPNLVELSLQNLTLRSTEMEELVRAISSATNLRSLRLNSIAAYREGSIQTRLATTIDFPSQKFLFPKLETLSIEDVRFVVLKALFQLIQPRPDSHEITLRLSNPEELDRFHEDLGSLFQGANIVTLILTQSPLQRWSMHRLLKSMPTLTTLYIDSATFDTSILQCLGRPLGSAPNTQASPAIRNLYITRANIRSLQSLKDFMASYPTENLVLGGHLSERGTKFKGCTPETRDGKWLQRLLPHLQLVDWEVTPTVLDSVWELWGPVID